MGKEEGRVVGLWPGSCLHALRALANPRWEDFEYVRLDDQHNRLHWLGNGMTWNEEKMEGNRKCFSSILSRISFTDYLMHTNCRSVVSGGRECRYPTRSGSSKATMNTE